MLQEKILRNLTLNLINKEFSSDPTNLVVEEMGLSFGDSRVDIAVINGNMIGFEIKSDYDNLKRLPRQIDMYQKYFDRVSIVTTTQHLKCVLKMVPDSWGIYVAKDKSALRRVRAAKRNRDIDGHYLVKLLWKDEVIAHLQSKGLKGFKSKTKAELHDLLLSSFPLVDLKNIVRNTLKRRSTWRVG